MLGLADELSCRAAGSLNGSGTGSVSRSARRCACLPKLGMTRGVESSRAGSSRDSGHEVASQSVSGRARRREHGK